MSMESLVMAPAWSLSSARNSSANFCSLRFRSSVSDFPWVNFAFARCLSFSASSVSFFAIFSFRSLSTEYR